MQETKIRKPSTRLAEKAINLAIIKCAPTWQRNLKFPDSERTTPVNSLDDGREREADDADHRTVLSARHLGMEGPDDLFELAIGNRVAFASSAENIQAAGE